MIGNDLAYCNLTSIFHLSQYGFISLLVTFLNPEYIVILLFFFSASKIVFLDLALCMVKILVPLSFSLSTSLIFTLYYNVKAC